MEWLWFVAYPAFGLAVVPFCAVYDYRQEARKNVCSNPHDEIARLRREASSAARAAFLCVPLWPVFFIMVISDTVKRFNLGGFGLARKDIRRLEAQIVDKKAEAIAAEYRKNNPAENPDAWQREFETQ